MRFAVQCAQAESGDEAVILAVLPIEDGTQIAHLQQRLSIETEVEEPT